MTGTIQVRELGYDIPQNNVLCFIDLVQSVNYRDDFTLGITVIVPEFERKMNISVGRGIGMVVVHV